MIRTGFAHLSRSKAGGFLQFATTWTWCVEVTLRRKPSSWSFRTARVVGWLNPSPSTGSRRGFGDFDELDQNPPGAFRVHERHAVPPSPRAGGFVNELHTGIF